MCSGTGNDNKGRKGEMKLILLVSCATATTQATQSGFLGDYYKNLVPGPEDGAKMRWMNPDVDIS